MFGDPATVFLHDVLRTFDRYLQARGQAVAGASRHLSSAVQAAGSLFHFREHLTGSLALSRAEVTARCPSFRLIADVANASKHKVLTKQTSDGPPMVGSAEDVVEMLLVIRFSDPEGDYNHSATKVMVHCTDGVERCFDDALSDVFQFWARYLLSRGALLSGVSRPAFVDPVRRYVSRDRALEPSLEATQGLDLKQTFQFLKFDPTAGLAQPVDLTGKDLQMWVYNGRPMLAVTLNAPKITAPLKIQLELNHSEARRFLSALNQEARQKALRQTLDERREEVQAKMQAYVIEHGISNKQED